MSKYSELLKPGRIGNLKLNNRFVMPPMFSGLGVNGYVTDRMREYYEERAKGGVGMIIVEDTAVEEPRGWSSATRLRINNDKYVPGLAELTASIHKHGAKVAAQLGHLAVRADSTPSGFYQLSPSPGTGPDGKPTHPLTVEEIAEIVDFFAVAARRARQADFDAVEIHGAHRFLMTHFLSPATNKRNDEYGGNIESRARFLCEVVQRVRKAVGTDFPIWCRINGEETNVPDAIHLAELPVLSHLLEASGVDALHVSGANPIRSYFSPQGYFVHAASIVKRSVKIPVIVCGGLTPEAGEKVLGEGKADFVSMGRCLIADPFMPEKIAQGKSHLVNTCIRCMECINSVLIKDEPIVCSVNPCVTREKECRLKPASKRKKVIVVGGGPSGMAATGTAAMRGHDVSLVERATVLGGQMLLASKPPHKEYIASLIQSMTAQMAEVKVHVELGTEATSVTVQQAKPDAVLIATGVAPIVPDIEGVRGKNVVTAEDVLAERAVVGDGVVVIGGGLIGCETALFLAERGKTVVIVELLPQIAPRVIPAIRDQLLAQLKSKGIATMTGVKCERINESSLDICNDRGDKQEVQADTVVLAVGGMPRQGLASELAGKVPEVHIIGDAVKQENIMYAIRSAFEIASVL